MFAIVLIGIAAGLIISTAIDKNRDSDQISPPTESANIASTATSTSPPTSTPTEPVAATTQTETPTPPPTATDEPSATETEDEQPATASPASGLEVQLLQAEAPALEAPTIASFERLYAYYAETYTIGNFTIRWRPGAFPPERAQEVADQATMLLAEVNERLGTDDYRPIDIFLADRLFDPQCLACQGFAASDYRQVFVLQDGSLAPDEFEALLIHEITHVVAGGTLQLPHVAGLFYAEGLATWMMAPHFAKYGYIEPEQTAAWALERGLLPSIDYLLFDAGYEGRTRKRIEYDAACSFTRYIIETYGIDAYKEMYKREVLPLDIIGKSYPELEQEWHDWLRQWSTAEVNGINGEQWWNAMNLIITGYDQVYAAPQSVSARQYSNLASARVALNRGDLQGALQLAQLSGLVPRSAS